MGKCKYMKQTVVWLLIISMLFSLTACGSKENSKEEVNEKSEKEMVFSEEDIGITGQLKGEINSFQVVDDTVYAYCVEWNEGYYDESEEGLQPEPVLMKENETHPEHEQMNGNTVSANETISVSDNNSNSTQVMITQSEENLQVLVNGEADESVFVEENVETQADTVGVMNEYFYSFGVDGSNLKLLFSNSGISDNNWLSYFAVSSIGYIYLLYDRYDITSETNSYWIKVLDADGKQQNLLDITDIFEGDDTYFTGILVDKKQQICLIGEEYFYMLSSDGHKKRAIKLEGWGHNMIQSKDGRILIETNLDDSKHMLFVYDPQEEVFEKPIDLPERVTGSYEVFPSDAEYLFHYMDDNGIYGYREDTQEMDRVVDFNSSNIDINFYSSMQSVSGGRFFANYTSYEDETARNTLFIFNKVDASQVKEKITVVYGGVYVDDTIRSKAIEYNKSQDVYQVVVKDFKMMNEDPVKAMREAIASGDVPDIIDLSNLSVDECISKGILEDIYPYIDQDPELSRNDFIESILGALEYDGKLYHISPSFGINVLAGRETDITNKLRTFTISDLLELECSKENAKSFYMTSNIGVLDYFFNANYSHFVDWPSGKCYFDGDEFIQILDFANRYPNEDAFNWEDGVESQSSMIQMDTLLFAQVYNMDMLEIEIYEDMFDQDVCFMGCPGVDKNAVSIHLNSDTGIYAKSECKDGAWDFLRTMIMKDEMTELAMSNFYGGMPMPIRKDVFENQLKRYSTTVDYIDEFGNKVEPVKDFTWGYDDVELQLMPLSENEVETIRDLVYRVDRVTCYNAEISDIIHEESKLFFHGNKSVEEAATAIQQKVTAYINENR